MEPQSGHEIEICMVYVQLLPGAVAPVVAIEQMPLGSSQEEEFFSFSFSPSFYSFSIFSSSFFSSFFMLALPLYCSSMHYPDLATIAYHDQCVHSHSTGHLRTGSTCKVHEKYMKST